VGTLVHTHEAYQEAFGEISALGERFYRLKVNARDPTLLTRIAVLPRKELAGLGLGLGSGLGLGLGLRLGLGLG